MYIDLIIEKTLRESKLRKIRIKVDPSELAVFGYENVSSFEGYILEEGLDTVRVFMIGVPQGINPIQTVNRQHITTVEPSPISSRFLEFKSKLLQQLEKEGIQKDNPQHVQIQNCNNPEFIDSYLKELKFDDKKISDLYKSIFLSEALTPGTMSNLAGKISKGIGDVASSPWLKAAHKGAEIIGSIPGLIIGRNNIIARVAKFMKSFDLNDLVQINKKQPSER